MPTKTDRTKRTILKQLTVKEIAFCGDGVDEAAQMVIWKARDAQPIGKDMAPRTTAEVLEVKEAWKQWACLRDAFTESMYSILDYAEPGERIKLLKQTVQEFADAAGDILDLLPAPVTKAMDQLADASDEDEFKAAADSLTVAADEVEKAMIAGAKPAPAPKEGVMFDPKKLDAAGQEAWAAMEKAKKDAEDKLTALAAEVEKLKAAQPAPAAKPEDVLKDMTPGVRALFEKQAADLAAQTARTEELVTKAKTAEDARAHAEAVSKAKEIGTVAGATEAELVEILKAAKGVKALEKVEDILKTAARVVQTSRLMGSDGREGSAAGSGGASDDPLHAKAVEIQKAKGVSYPAAYDIAYRENPDLARQAVGDSRKH